MSKDENSPPSYEDICNDGFAYSTETEPAKESSNVSPCDTSNTPGRRSYPIDDPPPYSPSPGDNTAVLPVYTVEYPPQYIPITDAYIQQPRYSGPLSEFTVHDLEALTRHRPSTFVSPLDRGPKNKRPRMYTIAATAIIIFVVTIIVTMRFITD